jgi:hypothetical protein
MSLLVVLKSLNPKTKKEFHVPFSGTLPNLDPDEIEFIQADGDELDCIRDLFTTFGEMVPGVGRINQILSIPIPKHRVVRWYGDIAKTIYFNLR